MYRIWSEKTADGKEVVRRIEQLEDSGFDYTNIPEKPPVEGRKELVLTRDPETGELSWMEVDRPPTSEEKMEDLENENNELRQAILELTMMMTASQS